MFRKNTSGQYIHFQGVDASTGGIKSGVTWTVRRCIDGTFAAGSGTVTEDGSTGWYKYAMSQADTNGNDIGFNFTGTGAVPQTLNIVTTAADPTDGVRLGLTALPNAAAGASGGLPLGDASGRVDLGKILGTAVSTPATAGILDVNVKNMNNVAATSITTINAHQGTTQPLNFTGTAASALVKTDMVDIAGAAVSTSTAQLGVNVVTNADKTGYSLSQAFPTNFASLAITVGGAVTAGTVSDKTGYSLTQTFPTNFASMAITAGGAVTAGTVSDKTGYSLTQAFPTNFASMAITAGGALTVGTNNDKTGYSLTQAFPSNFAALGISVGGHITTVDTLTTYTGNTPQTGDSYARLGAPAGASVSADIVAINAKTTNLPASPAATGDAMTLTSVYNFAKGTVAMTESYPSLHSAPTPAQILFEMRAHLCEKNVVGTTLTTNRIDGSTLAETFTLNDATAPTAITRAS